MTLQLPGEKLRKIRKRCQELLAQTTVSVRELSKFLGLLTSSIQAIFPALFHYRHFQRLKNTTLVSQKTYNAMVALDQAANEEILWRRDHLLAWNGRTLFQDPVDRNRCLTQRVGDILSVNKNSGSIVLRRKEASYISIASNF